ncbi:hypothetical protein B0H16DRAFT_1465044 [Mycena metata]|uniref:Uncharacterized protein n=1 Tax=Mycena metata TaxID=1033252 RepID=A0AAD7IC51_9AGAR|nr:hypothetical protein B0H16DRAFT_1465044 [Mycena metata]
MSDWELVQISSGNLRQTVRTSLQYNELQGPAARVTRGERNLEEKRKEWNESTESEAKSSAIQWLIVLVEASEAVDGGVGVGGGVIWSVGCERCHGGNQSLERESSCLLRQTYTLYLHTDGHNVIASDANEVGKWRALADSRPCQCGTVLSSSQFQRPAPISGPK